jgi:hypothetical protein
MGRAHNSFTSYVGHAEETISDQKVDIPEKDLWVAVLCRASLDAFNKPPSLNLKVKTNRSHHNIYKFDRDQARHFFLNGGPHFNLICEMAGRNPQYVQEKARKLILKENGWNVDVPITSHYRQGPKRGRGRPKKTNTTVNAYYAAMGKKGGRPKKY